jgi:hypothetical protein
VIESDDKDDRPEAQPLRVVSDPRTWDGDEDIERVLDDEAERRRKYGAGWHSEVGGE